MFKKILEFGKTFKPAIYARRLYFSKKVSRPKWNEIIARNSYLWHQAKTTKSNNKPKILIATGIGHFYAATALESLLAAALTVRGAEVHFLLCDSFLPACQACTFYNTKNIPTFIKDGPKASACLGCHKTGVSTYGQLGLKVIRYSQFISTQQIEEISRIVNTTPAKEIQTYVKDGIAIGEHATAGALRFYANGTLDNEPEGEAVLRAYFGAALRTYHIALNLSAEQGYTSVVLHHGIYVPQGIFAEVFRNSSTRVVTWNPAYRSKTFIFSHNDTYHHTLISEDPETWKHIKWNPQLENILMQYLGSRRDGSYDWISFLRNPSNQQTAIDLSKPTIGMLTNVMWDAQLHYPANAFKNMLEWCIKTIKYFGTRPDLQLVIRVHPAEVSGFMPSRQPVISEVKKIIPELPQNVFFIPPDSTVSTYDVMEKCDAVIIYGTKTGVELTARGIPVIVAGEAWIRNKGITIDVSDENEYYKILDTLPFNKRLSADNMEKAKMYAFHFFFRRMIPISWTQPTGQVGMPYIVTVDDLKDLAAGRDRGLDVVCDGILHNKDFIYKAENLT